MKKAITSTVLRSLLIQKGIDPHELVMYAQLPDSVLTRACRGKPISPLHEKKIVEILVSRYSITSCVQELFSKPKGTDL